MKINVTKGLKTSLFHERCIFEIYKSFKENNILIERLPTEIVIGDKNKKRIKKFKIENNIKREIGNRLFLDMYFERKNDVFGIEYISNVKNKICKKNKIYFFVVLVKLTEITQKTNDKKNRYGFILCPTKKVKEKIIMCIKEIKKYFLKKELKNIFIRIYKADSSCFDLKIKKTDTKITNI